MVFDFCSSQAIVIKAGANVSAVAQTSNAILSQYSNEAQALINNVAQYDFETNWGSLKTNAKTLLGEVASNLGGIYLIGYDMSSASRIELEDRVNILRDAALRGLSLLRDTNVKEFIGKVTT